MVEIERLRRQRLSGRHYGHHRPSYQAQVAASSRRSGGA
jgi:hypothetical protein